MQYKKMGINDLPSVKKKSKIAHFSIQLSL